MTMLLQGYVLHQYAYGDDSAIVKLFTQESGYLTAIAKHIKSRRVGWKNVLRPFTLLNIELTGRSQMLTMRSVEAITPAVHLLEKRLYAGLYLNELLFGFLPEKEPMPDLFDAYQQTLLQLSKEALEPVLRSFEWYVLSLLGYMPTLQIDQHHQPVLLEQYYQVLPGHLPQCREPHMTSGAVYQGKHLQGIAAQNWQCQDTLKAAKQFMRNWIAHYRQGKPLKSRSLFL